MREAIKCVNNLSLKSQGKAGCTLALLKHIPTWVILCGLTQWVSFIESHENCYIRTSTNIQLGPLVGLSVAKEFSRNGQGRGRMGKHHFLRATISVTKGIKQSNEGSQADLQYNTCFQISATFQKVSIIYSRVTLLRAVGHHEPLVHL